MRATISFETDVDQVSDVMMAVVKKETDNIRSVAHILDTTQPHELRAKLGESLEALYKVTHQLEQYRNMLDSFERARFETMLPQPADQPESVPERDESQAALRFDSFLNQMVAPADERVEDDTEDG